MTEEGRSGGDLGELGMVSRQAPSVQQLECLPPGTAALAWTARNRALPTIVAIRQAAAVVLRHAPAAR